MDSGSNTRKRAIDGKGIFSKLPEQLITRILSFLSTKEAVCTSVLSKKWRYRWTCINKHDFSDIVTYYRKKKTGSKQHFVNFVYSLLLFTNPSIESFCLVIADKYDPSLVNTWISSVLNRRVKILRIKSHFELSFSAPTSYFLFNSSGLEELKLNLCSIRVPTTSVYFESLKFLKLNGITFTLDSSSNYSENRELRFPVLKNFEIINCVWLNAKGIITIKAPLLERIFIDHDPKKIPNELDKSANKFCFSASPLKEFTYNGHGYIALYIVLLDPSSAHNASATIILNKCKDKVADTVERAFSLLKQFSQVRSLKFEEAEVLQKSRRHELPSFGMLSHLELDLVTCEVLLGLLLRSPILKTLVLKRLSDNFEKERLQNALVPPCFLSTLKMVKFANVEGHEHELCLAKFVMENCLVLERMTFSVGRFSWKWKAVEDFKEKVFSFKKGSKNLAIVEFSI